MVGRAGAKSTSGWSHLDGTRTLSRRGAWQGTRGGCGADTAETANGTRRWPRAWKHAVPVQICQLGSRDDRSLSRAGVHVAYCRIRSYDSMTAAWHNPSKVAESALKFHYQAHLKSATGSLGTTQT